MRVGIVGAGPAGSLLALELGRLGAAPTLFDASHPREKPCGGGLTGKALRLLPDAPDHDPLPARFAAACRFESGLGERVDVELERPVAIAARSELDAWLLRRALAAGALHVAERVVAVLEGGVLRTAKGRERRFDVVVGADGASSLVRRTLLGPLPPGRLTMAAGWYASGDARMTVSFLPGLAGYLWMFPRRGHVGVGICAPLGSPPTRALLARLESELARGHAPLLGSRESRYAHLIASPTASESSLLEIAGAGWALVGDAAALADPITGEGIYYALRSAQLLAETLRADGSPLRYPERLLADFGHELLRAAALRERFYADGFTRRMIRYAARSGTIRRILGELVLGEQGYAGLKRRLAAALPRFLFDSAVAKAAGRA